jgi:hypothetical protein
MGHNSRLSRSHVSFRRLRTWRLEKSLPYLDFGRPLHTLTLAPSKGPLGSSLDIVAWLTL